MAGMGPALAVGVPGWPHGAPSWDWLPLLGVVLAVFVVRFGIGARLSLRTTALAALSGTAWAYAADRWGVPIPTAAALLLVAFLPSVVRHLRAR